MVDRQQLVMLVFFCAIGNASLFLSFAEASAGYSVICLLPHQDKNKQRGVIKLGM